jgi:hypothetical protein
VGRVELGGGGDEGIEVEGFGEFGEDGVEHVVLVCFEGEELLFAGDDDLIGWISWVGL